MQKRKENVAVWPSGKGWDVCGAAATLMCCSGCGVAMPVWDGGAASLTRYIPHPAPWVGAEVHVGPRSPLLALPADPGGLAGREEAPSAAV